MKRIIIFILFLLIVNPVLAGNVLQQQDELKYIQEIGNNPMPLHYGKDYLIREDYYGYYNGKNSVYGYVVNTLEDISKSNILNKDLNIKYLTLLKTKIETIVKLQNNNIDNNMRLNAARQKIIIDDDNYKKLSQQVKDILTMCNCVMFD